MRFTAQDVWSFVAAAVTVSALYWGLANKLDMIAHANDRKTDLVMAQNTDILKKLEKIEQWQQQHSAEAAQMRERISKVEQEQVDHERMDAKRFSR